MAAMKTIGEDNILKLTVVVSWRRQRGWNGRATSRPFASRAAGDVRYGVPA